jgi:hypothetical protein
VDFVVLEEPTAQLLSTGLMDLVSLQVVPPRTCAGGGTGLVGGASPLPRLGAGSGTSQVGGASLLLRRCALW